MATTPLSRAVRLPIEAEGLSLRAASHEDSKELAQGLVAERPRSPETLGRGMRLMRELVLKAGAALLDARAQRHGTLVARDGDGMARAYVEGEVRDGAGGRSARLHWSALPGDGNADVVAVAARVVVSSLFEAGCAKVAFSYDDDEPLLAVQGEALGFEPDPDDPTGELWSVTPERFAELAAGPSGP